MLLFGSTRFGANNGLLLRYQIASGTSLSGFIEVQQWAKFIARRLENISTSLLPARSQHSSSNHVRVFPNSRLCAFQSYERRIIKNGKPGHRLSRDFPASFDPYQYGIEIPGEGHFWPR